MFYGNYFTGIQTLLLKTLSRQNCKSEFLKNSIFEENMGVMDWALPRDIM